MSEVQYVRHEEIDKNLWDACIHQACNAQIYALSWYLDVVSPHWEALVVKEDTRYIVCFPLTVRKKLGFKYIAHPFFCQQLGLFYIRKPEQAVVDKILQKLFTYFPYIPTLSFNIQNDFRSYACENLRKKRLCTHLLPLNRSYQTIHHNYRRDRKYRLKQAKERGLNIHRADEIESLIEIFKKDTAHKLPGAAQSQDPNYTLLKRVFDAVKAKGKYELYYIKDENGVYNCGCWFVFYKNTIIYLFNASTAETRDQNGRTLIINHIIEKYQNSDYLLDFESPEKPEIRSFYASFGSEATPYYQFYYNNLPTVVKHLHTLKIQIHRRLLTTLYPDYHLPDIQMPVTNNGT